jgi:hypothetical protein
VEKTPRSSILLVVKHTLHVNTVIALLVKSHTARVHVHTSSGKDTPLIHTAGGETHSKLLLVES